VYTLQYTRLLDRMLHNVSLLPVINDCQWSKEYLDGVKKWYIQLLDCSQYHAQKREVGSTSNSGSHAGACTYEPDLAGGGYCYPAVLTLKLEDSVRQG